MPSSFSLRTVEDARPYGVALSWCEIVGRGLGPAVCKFRRDVVGAVPYEFYPGWCDVVGTTIGRPFCGRMWASAPTGLH